MRKRGVWIIHLVFGAIVDSDRATICQSSVAHYHGLRCLSAFLGSRTGLKESSLPAPVLKLHHSLDVFGDDVGFEVDGVAGF